MVGAVDGHDVRVDPSGNLQAGICVWQRSLRSSELLLVAYPPLDRGTTWIEISATGQSDQVRATLPLSSQ